MKVYIVWKGSYNFDDTIVDIYLSEDKAINKLKELNGEYGTTYYKDEHEVIE